MMLWVTVAALLARADEGPSPASPMVVDDPLLSALTEELGRTWEAWSSQEDAPYFLGYRVTDERRWNLTARYGQVARRSEEQRRTLDVSARVGSPALDSEHALKGDFVAGTNFHIGRRLPVDGDPVALRTEIWAATNTEIRNAQERWLHVLANQTVKVDDVDDSADFSEEPPVRALGFQPPLVVDLAAWEPALRRASALLDGHPDVHQSYAAISGLEQITYVVTSEGTRVREPYTSLRLVLGASSTAEDGGEVQLSKWEVVLDPEHAPDPSELDGWAVDLRRQMIEQREAELGQPYSGPVLLRGKAAGVFVHEVLGHRSEGHRIKDEDEGHTFRDKVGERILPASISIVDDPTLATYGGQDLAGHYAFDDEGVPAERTVLVRDGVFRGFLMGRTPIEGFPRSNGHGRAQPGRLPVSRMGNTILETSRPVREARLRRQLQQELRRQGREWGLLVDEIDGGFTMTGRVMPNAFNVRAVVAAKVFADGRPDEPVRGVDLVGTPQIALANVLAAGDDPKVFNGMCGAESGSVPVSAVSPSLLLRTLEVQKKEKGAERPPLLPKPVSGGDT